MKKCKEIVNYAPKRTNGAYHFRNKLFRGAMRKERVFTLIPGRHYWEKTSAPTTGELLPVLADFLRERKYKSIAPNRVFTPRVIATPTKGELRLTLKSGRVYLTERETQKESKFDSDNNRWSTKKRVVKTVSCGSYTTTKLSSSPVGECGAHAIIRWSEYSAIRALKTIVMHSVYTPELWSTYSDGVQKKTLDRLESWEEQIAIEYADLESESAVYSEREIEHTYVMHKNPITGKRERDYNIIPFTTREKTEYGKELDELSNALVQMDDSTIVSDVAQECALGLLELSNYGCIKDYSDIRYFLGYAIRRANTYIRKSQRVSDKRSDSYETSEPDSAQLAINNAKIKAHEFDLVQECAIVGDTERYLLRYLYEHLDNRVNKQAVTDVYFLMYHYELSTREIAELFGVGQTQIVRYHKYILRVFSDPSARYMLADLYGIAIGE